MGVYFLEELTLNLSCDECTKHDFNLLTKNVWIRLWWGTGKYAFLHFIYLKMNNKLLKTNRAQVFIDWQKLGSKFRVESFSTSKSKYLLFLRQAWYLRNWGPRLRQVSLKVKNKIFLRLHFKSCHLLFLIIIHLIPFTKYVDRQQWRYGIK